MNSVFSVVVQCKTCYREQKGAKAMLIFWPYEFDGLLGGRASLVEMTAPTNSTRILGTGFIERISG
jgi:hypothetical protein